MNSKRTQVIRGAALAGVAVLALAACSSSDAGDDATTTADATVGAGGDAGAELSGELTVWAWEPTLTDVVADFETAHPDVAIDLVNAGTGNDQYIALQNAISAGSGVPDVAQVEYYALPQFSIADSLADIGPLGASDLDERFTPGPWAAVTSGDAIYGLPMDSGPMALFYNKDVFDEYGVEVPTTWDEYLQAARDIHAANPDAYIANDTGDAGFTTSMIWQAGGQPYSVDGTNVGIDFTDAGSQQFAEFWQQLIDEGLLAPTGSWSDEWYQGLGNGTIATLTIGAWMPANLESGVPDAAGQWRVAQMPQWTEGATDTSENGGSALSVTSASENQDLAYAFLDYANSGDGVQTRIDGGAFPATNDEINADDFVNKEFEYFGGQKVNEVLAASAANVVAGWQYLPFQVYANSIFGDTVGQAYVSDTTLTDGLQAWQDASIEYGTDQGFTMNP